MHFSVLTDTCSNPESSSETGEDSESDDRPTDVEVWDLDSRDVVEDFDSVAIGDDHVQDLEDSSLRKTIRWVMLFIFLWASFYGVSANAVGHLIKFFHTLLDSLSHYSAFIASLAALFPPSIYLAKKYLKLDKENFSRFVVCAGCHTLYHFHDCYERVGSQHVAKVCFLGKHFCCRDYSRPKRTIN